MEEIYKGDTINLSFEVRYPRPIKTAELKLEKGNLTSQHDCSIKDNIVSALIKGETLGWYTAWFKCLFEDDSVRSFPIDFIVKEKEEKNLDYEETINNIKEVITKNPDKAEKIRNFIDSKLQDPAIRDKFYNIWNQKMPKNGIEKQAPGNFSMPKQTTMDDETQQTPPKEVKDDDRIVGGSAQKENKEPYFEKAFNPEIDDDSFYKMIDDLLIIEPDLQKTHLHKPEAKLPLGSKKLAEQCELELYRGLRDRLDGWFDTVNKDSDPDEVISDLKMSLHKWAKDEKSQVRESIQQLYNRGLEAGIKSTGIPTKQPVKKIDYVIYRDIGISPAVNRFRDEAFDNISKIIRKHYDPSIGIPLYKTKKDCDSFLHKQRYQTRRMLKTETARTANWGLLKAWDEDPDKYKFNYYWQSVIDDKTKNISKMRYENNPYSFDECKFLWEHQIQKIGDKLINDSFNQRCYLSRGPIDYEFKSNRFYGQEFDYRRTLPRT